MKYTLGRIVDVHRASARYQDRDQLIGRICHFKEGFDAWAWGEEHGDKAGYTAGELWLGAQNLYCHAIKVDVLKHL